MIKLIMSDMDGTLLDAAGELPVGFGELAAELKARGILFAPCSGRQYASLVRSFADYTDDFIFIAENGTLVKYRGEELAVNTVDRALELEVLDYMHGIPDVYEVFCGKNNGYTLADQQAEVFTGDLNKYYSNAAVVESFADVDDEPIKMSFFDGNGRAAETIYPRLVERYGDRLQISLSSAYWVDVMNLDINKGIAVQALQQRLGIKPSECAAFGDYLNDLELMGAVDYSFAMANAHEDIKRAARYETTSNLEGGVLTGIRRLMAEGLCG